MGLKLPQNNKQDLKLVNIIKFIFPSKRFFMHVKIELRSKKINRNVLASYR